MRLEDISLDDLIEVLAPGGVIDDDTGVWTTWTGEELAFGSPSFPFVCLRREEPWCEIRFYHWPSANTWITADATMGGGVTGEFGDKSSVNDAFLVSRTLMQLSVAGTDSVFPSTIFDERPSARNQSRLARVFRHKRVLIGFE